MKTVHLTYRSPMSDKYTEWGEILMGGSVLAEMATTDDFILREMAAFNHGSDGGGLQLEIDEIGQKLVLAYNCHDELLAACEQALEQLQHCDCSNEVTTSEGDQDEGVVWALQTEEQLRTAIRKAKGNP